VKVRSKKSYSIEKGSVSRRWPRIIVIGGLVLLIILAGSAFAVRRTYNENLQPVSASQHRVLVNIESGASATQIAVQLKQQGLIRADWAFEWYVRNHNLRDKLQAGSYYLTPSQSVPEIMEVLTQGKIATDLVTILPGQRLDQVRKALINSGFPAADVDEALKPTNYRNHPALVDKPVDANLEGYLYPDSYQRTANTKPADIVRVSLDQMADHLTPELRAGIAKQGLTVYQGVVLASIIEQEVGKVSDKPTVAQVFLKRLRDGMVMGSDVTNLYGSLLAGHQPPSLTYDSPYNTHLHQGLPPGPISNVSKESLQAVAKPGTTDYVYFVAGDDGLTYFSRTLEEHEALVRAHCKKLCGGE
jgi:UPF0755 protein